MQIGASSPDKIMIDAQEVTKIMLNGVVVYGSGQNKLTGDAAIFLDPPSSHTYTGSGQTLTYENLDPDKVFPYGQRMAIMAHGLETQYIADAERAGVSIGFWQSKYDDVNTQALMERLADTSIYYLGYIRAATPTSDTYPLPKDSFNHYSEAELIGWAETEMDRYLNDPNGGDRIWGWCYPLDDGTNSVDSTKLGNVFDGMNAHSSLPNGSFGTNAMFNSYSESRYIPEFTHALQQAYMYGGSTHECLAMPNWYSYHFSREMFALINYTASQADTNPPNNLPRVIPMGLGPFFWHLQTEVTALANDTDFAMREFIYNLLTGFMAGANSYWIYQLKRSYPAGYHTDLFADTVIAEFFDFMESLKVNDVTKALLWGEGTAPKDAIKNEPNEYNPENVDFGVDYVSPNGITRSRLSGETDYPTRLFWSKLHDGGMSGTYAKSKSPDYRLDPLTWRDLKFEDKRFIIATNMIPVAEITAFYEECPAATNGGTIRERFSGFPDDGTANQLVVTDILSGTVYPIVSGYVDVDIPALGSVLLSVTPAPGYEGGIGEPLPPEENLPLNQTESAFQTWVAGKTSNDPLTIIALDDSRISNRSVGEFFSYESADYLVFYCPAGSNISAGFDMSGFATTCQVDDYLGGSWSGIDVGVNQQISYNDSGNMGGMIYIKEAGSLAITRDPSNHKKWIYNQQPITLMGGLWTHQPFLQSDVDMKQNLADLVAAGGNYHRCNTGIYPLTAITDAYPFTGAPGGSFDLMSYTSGAGSYWQLLTNYLDEMERLDCVCTVELWDPHYMKWGDTDAQTSQDCPWRPQNNTTYNADETEPNPSGLSDEAQDTPTSTHGFYQLDHTALVDAQEAFVLKLLQTVEPYPNVLIQIENESPGPDAWTQHWIDFVHANSSKNVLEMNANGNLEEADAQRAIYLNTDGGDISQNGRDTGTVTDGDTAYRRLTTYIDAMEVSASERPVNSSKTYTRESLANGLNSQGMYFCSDVGLFGQHKGPSTPGDYSSDTTGIGGTSEGNRMLTVMRAVDAKINRNSMRSLDIPADGIQDNDNWTSREANLCYAILGNNQIVVFYSSETTYVGTDIIATAIPGTSCRIEWIDADGATGNVESTEDVAKVGGFVALERPDANKRYFAVISATP